MYAIPGQQYRQIESVGVAILIFHLICRAGLRGIVTGSEECRYSEHKMGCYSVITPRILSVYMKGDGQRRKYMSQGLINQSASI